VTTETKQDSLGWGNAILISSGAILSVVLLRRMTRCERDLARERARPLVYAPTDALMYEGELRNARARPVLGSFAAERAVRWFQDVANGARRNACVPCVPEGQMHSSASVQPASGATGRVPTDESVDANDAAAANPAAGATAPRDARTRDPAHRERSLIGDRAGYRAWAFWTGAPPESAKVGDAWAYIEQPSGKIMAKKRFRTQAEAWTYAKAALKRAVERTGIDWD